MELTGKCKKDFEKSEYFNKAVEQLEHDFYFYDLLRVKSTLPSAISCNAVIEFF